MLFIPGGRWWAARRRTHASAARQTVLLRRWGLALAWARGRRSAIETMRVRKEWHARGAIPHPEPPPRELSRWQAALVEAELRRGYALRVTTTLDHRGRAAHENRSRGRMRAARYTSPGVRGGRTCHPPHTLVAGCVTTGASRDRVATRGRSAAGDGEGDPRGGASPRGDPPGSGSAARRAGARREAVAEVPRWGADPDHPARRDDFPRRA